MTGDDGELAIVVYFGGGDGDPVESGGAVLYGPAPGAGTRNPTTRTVFLRPHALIASPSQKTLVGGDQGELIHTCGRCDEPVGRIVVP